MSLREQNVSHLAYKVFTADVPDSSMCEKVGFSVTGPSPSLSTGACPQKHQTHRCFSHKLPVSPEASPAGAKKQCPKRGNFVFNCSFLKR